MNFNEYQKKSRRTAIYPHAGNNFIYPTLGLSGETGEVAEKIKKILRDKEGKLDSENRDILQKELGDVLWYLAQIATETGLSLEDIAQGNLDKLRNRQKDNKLQGEGDDR